MGMKLTMRRLRAMEEALVARLAGSIDATDIERGDYDAALGWVEERIERIKAAQRLWPTKR